MELWIPITIAAAFLQNLRFMLQKHVRGRLSTFGATYARFIWAVPIACLITALLQMRAGSALPALNAGFFVHAAIGGIAQILATALLVALFSLRNFAVGVTFSKTETILAALFGIFILGEAIGAGGLFAIGVSLIGVILISTDPAALSWRALFGAPTLYGLGSGALFGLSAVSYRAASLSLPSGDAPLRAAVTLASVTILQTCLMSLYLVLREPGEITRVLRAWRLTSLVGITGVLGSFGWFTAMTLQNAALVRALGQVELIFTFAASYFIFRERASGREILGICLVTSGIVILLLAH